MKAGYNKNTIDLILKVQNGKEKNTNKLFLYKFKEFFVFSGEIKVALGGKEDGIC